MSDHPAERRLKMFRFSKQVTIHLFEQGSAVEITDGIPSGSVIDDCGYEPERQTFYLTVGHESFDPVAEDEPIPIGTIEATDLPTARDK